MSPPLLHWVFGTQGKHGQVLQRQPQPTQAFVELLSKCLAHLVAFILQGKAEKQMSTKKNMQLKLRYQKKQQL